MKLSDKMIKGVLVFSLMLSALSAPSADDPHLWLEEVEGPKALEWVKARNQKTETALKALPTYKEFEPQVREVVLSQDRIPYPSIHGKYLYNFWQDSTHVRGIYRRTTVDSYRTDNPEWETVLDLDALANEEDENWVWHGADFLHPTSPAALISLSRGGTDADVVREFNLDSKQFVPDGFTVPEAKTSFDWLDQDRLLVATDFGTGTLTKAGYARIAKLWKRDTNLTAAQTLLEGEDTDVAVQPVTFIQGEKRHSFIIRALDFYNAEYHFLKPDSSLTKVPVPTHAELQAIFQGEMLFTLQKDWQRDEILFKSGSLISIPLTNMDSMPQIIFEPTESEVISSTAVTGNAVLVHTLNKVRGRIYSYTKQDGKYTRETLQLPPNGSVRIITTDSQSDRFYVQFEDYLTPPTLYEANREKQSIDLTKVKTVAPKFSAEGLEVEQRHATSRDGTQIPYFIIKKKDLKFDGSNPTLLYGYGGFQVPLTPGYAPVTGRVWLERGNVYVVANIRGGGELGPKWHQAALKENRQRAFDDFQAVARDLIDQKITSPEHLGIMGGSNGGLLMGAMFTQAPELFKAVVCQVPLLDMMRFHKLLAGHSWTGEYGDPEIEEQAAYIRKYSPYQNVQKETEYPHIFFVTSTKDDRVHPGHARKMAAKLEELGHPFHYYENIEGGHGAAANLEQKIYRTTLEFVYLTKMLEGDTPKPAK